jgi:hypothetical protein
MREIVGKVLVFALVTAGVVVTRYGLFKAVRELRWGQELGGKRSPELPRLMCPRCWSAIPLSIFRLAQQFPCPRCGALLATSRVYSALPILSIIVTLGVSHWLGARGVTLAVATVIFALPLNILFAKSLRSWWRFSLYPSPEELPAE